MNYAPVKFLLIIRVNVFAIDLLLEGLNGVVAFTVIG